MLQTTGPLNSDLKHSLVTSASSLSLQDQALLTSFQSTRCNVLICNQKTARCHLLHTTYNHVDHDSVHAIHVAMQQDDMTDSAKQVQDSQADNTTLQHITLLELPASGRRSQPLLLPVNLRQGAFPVSVLPLVLASIVTHAWDAHAHKHMETRHSLLFTVSKLQMRQ